MPFTPLRRRRWSVPLLAALLVALTAASAPPAGAQIDPPITDPLGAVDAWANAEALRRLLPDGQRAGREARKPPKARARTPKPTARELAALRFTRDPQVTERNNQAVVAQLADGVDPAVVIADIERNRALAHGALRAFDGRWSSGNLADVAAFALLSAFAGYHEKPELSSAGSLAVRRSARAALANSKRIRRTPDAELQTAAEMTEIRLIYLLAELNRARAAADADAVDGALVAIRIWVRDVYGLDVTAVRLTGRGFADRQRRAG